MASSEDVRNAWQDNIWTNKTVKAMTSKSFLYDVSVDSAFNMADLYYGEPGKYPTINFFLCLVSRQHEPIIMGNTRYTFQVRVQYYLQQEESSSNTYNTLVDRLEAVDDLVRTSLGGSWDGTVDYYNGGVPQDISVVTIDNKACWRGGFTYLGIKTV
jgi:hypothetical protein